MWSAIINILNRNVPGAPISRLKIKHVISVVFITLLIGAVYVSLPVRAIKSLVYAGVCSLPSASPVNEAQYQRVLAERNTLIKHLLFPESVAYDSLDDFGKTNLIREWVTLNIPKVSGQTPDSHDPSQNFARLILKALDGEAGFWCGGYAKILHYLYASFGFDSMTLDMGIESPNTHVVTLVKISFAGSTRIIVQDSYLGGTYYDPSNQPADIKKILEAAKNRDFTGFDFKMFHPEYRRVKNGIDPKKGRVGSALALVDRMRRAISDHCNMPQNELAYFWFPRGLYRHAGGLNKEVADIYGGYGLAAGAVICPK